MKFQICVVMSTYNGEKYIATQLDSILHQQDVDLLIYIRDDGSTDNTAEILKDYAKKYDNIKVSIEKNIGFRKSFLKALRDAPEFEYYGFCDQDDYWFPNKLHDTISLMNNKKSSLAFGNAYITDENLNSRSLLYTSISVPSFPESLSSSNTHGFLFCFNKKLRDLAIRYPIDSFTIPHDFWLVTLAGLFGSISFDKSMIVAQYRRLPNSVSRYRPFFLFFTRVESLFVDKGIVASYSKKILELYSDELSDEKKRLITAYAFYKENWDEKKFLLRKKEIKIKYKIKILLNKL